MQKHVVMVNRAPVLTLWGAVVAARMGYEWEEALTLGKAVAGLTAQIKGRRLGIFEERPGEAGQPPPKAGLGEEFWLEIVGRPVPAKRTKEGVRAVVKDQAIEPADVDRYLKGKFGDDLDAVREAMAAVADSFTREELADAAYRLYEKFRPKIASGKQGWGQKGELNLDLIRSLAK
jgi:hypothetical protein